MRMDLSHIGNTKHRCWPDRTSTQMPCSMYGKIFRQKPIKCDQRQPVVGVTFVPDQTPTMASLVQEPSLFPSTLT